MVFEKIENEKYGNIDEVIHKHNLSLGLEDRNEEIKFTVKSRITGKTIKVTFEGDAVTSKDCRDKILLGFNWSQGSLIRRKLKKYICNQKDNCVGYGNNMLCSHGTPHEHNKGCDFPCPIAKTAFGEDQKCVEVKK